LSFFILLNKDTVDCLIDSFSSCLLEIFFIALSIKIHNVFKKISINSFTFLLFGLLNLDIVSSILNIWNDPIVDIISPLCSLLNSHIFSWRNELINYQMLLSDFSCQFSDPVHQIFSLAMNNFIHVIKLSLHLAHFDRDFLDLLRLDLQLLLLTGEILLQSELLLLFLLQFLSNSKLFSSFFIQLTLSFHEFLLLFHGLFHCFRTVQKFLLHAFNFLEEFLLF